MVTSCLCQKRCHKFRECQIRRAFMDVPSLKLTFFAPENGWLKDDPFLLGPGLFLGTLSNFRGVWYQSADPMFLNWLYTVAKQDRHGHWKKESQLVNHSSVSHSRKANFAFPRYNPRNPHQPEFNRCEVKRLGKEPFAFKTSNNVFPSVSICFIKCTDWVKRLPLEVSSFSTGVALVCNARYGQVQR